MTRPHARGRRPNAGVITALVVAMLAAGGSSAAWAMGERDADGPQAAVTVTATPSPGGASPAAGDSPAVTAPDIDASATPPSIHAAPAYDLDSPDSVTVVVNKSRPLEPETYAPDDLMDLTAIPGGASQQLRAEAADALLALHRDAAAAGAGFSVSTAYRSYGFQESLFGDYADRRGVSAAETFSARPGYSEHQTGLGVDVYSSSACRLKRCFGEEDAGRWVADHGWEYGFVVRYPDGSEHVTGYIYEPWHLRYVGTDLAGEMRESGEATLEEFLGLDPAPDYP